jgi:thiamine-phosphate pyrophosphorylase
MICLVTDRRRLSPGAPVDEARARLLAQARDAVDAGVDLFQIRERVLEARDLAALVSDALALASGTATRVIVNERLDVALACGADGVHLRGDSIAVAAARRIAPEGFVVGRSVHGADEMAQVYGADYVIAGTVFPSASKPTGHALLGVDGLRAIVALTRLPVLAIGGMTDDRLEAVAATGAAGVAAIGLFSGGGGGDLKNLVERARFRFDRVRIAP